ncbi:hypothetical protein DMB92_01640 [Campylobacter sp. MIT 99-7217]|uniref:hypothetical protein n=1 Tax=Campylobacter sp. MIT 99-7217 TaxID=535091 RepID=UPI00115AF4BE|nr:hypothetical protein [Campylobacter sp. MIT 99-7217]TQR34688.1 hypothetical protein DMB92_01640 [Campylobacter sp. MIT 99-7217]
MKHLFVALSCPLAFTACAFFGFDNSYSVTYDTNPQGASIVCGGFHKGYSPYIAYYDKKALEESPYTEPCEAVWFSGAKAKFDNYLGSDMTKYPNGVHITLRRPDVPGLEKDMQFALQVKQLQNQENFQNQQLSIQQQQLSIQQQQLNNQAKGLQQQQKQHEQFMDYMNYGNYLR